MRDADSMCDADGQTATHWDNLEWHKAMVAGLSDADKAKLTIGKYYTYLKDQLESTGNVYENGLHVNNANGGGMTTATGGEKDTHLQRMCKHALMADSLLEKFQLLGVGCPVPQVPKPTPPTDQPCWILDTCPNPEPAKCDKIRRDMTTITSKFKIGFKYKECLNHHAIGTTKEQQMKFYCVSTGVEDQPEVSLGEANYRKEFRDSQGVTGAGWAEGVRRRLQSMRQAGQTEAMNSYFGNPNFFDRKGLNDVTTQ